MESDWNARGDIAQSERLKDWLETQSSVLNFWMDRLIEQGDELMMARLESHRKDLQGLIGYLG
jgi:hypothetical protein